MSIHSKPYSSLKFSALPKRRKQYPLLEGSFSILAMLAALSSQAAIKPDAVQKAQVVDSYGKRSLSFEANLGQTDPKVQFLSRGQGYSLFLTPTEAVLSLRKSDSATPFKPGKLPSLNSVKPAKTSTVSVLRMQLEGGNARARIEGIGELPGKTHYLRGKDPKAWRTGIPSFAKVKYNGIYPGIDLVYYGNQRQLEYDFIVAPGADPKAIHLRFDGAKQLSLDANGQLIVKIEGGEVIQRKPAIYQEIGGVRKVIDGSYVLSSGKEGKMSGVGFQVAQYDASKPLIIDPVLAYSTYLGGSGRDQGNAIAVDKFGNAYVTGTTASADFPVINTESSGSPSETNTDVFVTKFGPKGSVIYSAVLGGDSYEDGRDIALDRLGNIYLTGYTQSNNFPVQNPLQNDCIGNTNFAAFITKLNNNGTAVIYSTCYGGDTTGNAVAVDRFGNAYVTGYIQIYGNGFIPIVNAFQPTFGGGIGDAFVAKLNAEGNNLVYSTYLGGGLSYLSTVSNYDAGDDIAVDRFGNAYVTGITASEDFPTLNAVQPIFTFGLLGYDGFVTKLGASGNSLVFSTYLGGTESQGGTGIVADQYGNSVVTGDMALDIPSVCTVTPCDSLAVVKFSSTGTVLNAIRFGPPQKSFQDIAQDRFGNIYLTGGGFLGTNFPLIRSVQRKCNELNGDAFVVKLSQRGSVNYSTCVGGNSYEYGYGIAVDRFNNAYVTGVTESDDLPVVRAFQPSNAGLSDAFVVKITGR